MQHERQPPGMGVFGAILMVLGMLSLGSLLAFVAVIEAAR